MSPFKAQGANQALLDAHSLAQCLQQFMFISTSSANANKIATGISALSSSASLVVSPEQALIAYETEMCQRTRSKVLDSRMAAISLHSLAALHEGDMTRAGVVLAAAAAADVATASQRYTAAGAAAAGGGTSSSFFGASDT
jgi:hypothetical protein